MLEALFPYKVHLHMFQLEEYKPGRFLTWTFHNFLKRRVSQKKPLVWTGKAKFLFCGALFYAIVFSLVLYCVCGWLGLLGGVLLATQAYFFMVLSFFTLRPYEILNRFRVKCKVRRKILSLKKAGLQVIGITGSYGKTTTKEFLYTVLKTQYKVLRTPESYNTLFGIARVVDLELDENYDFFVCEMGAYKKGEIAELCSMVLPDHGILTGINEQHLERFGNIQSTVAAKFELADFVKGFLFLNTDSFYVKQYGTPSGCKVYSYGLSARECCADALDFSPEGIAFDLTLFSEKLQVRIPLFDKGSVCNAVGASGLAYKLGVPTAKISEGLLMLPRVPHRLEIRTLDSGIVLIDDAYSSNVAGFKNALEVLSVFPKRIKVLATPGIVELGKETVRIHQELGKMAGDICDFVFLIGENERTRGLQAGIGDGSKVLFLESVDELFAKLNDLCLERPVVLLENDLPDNY